MRYRQNVAVINTTGGMRADRLAAMVTAFADTWEGNDPEAHVTSEGLVLTIPTWQDK